MVMTKAEFLRMYAKYQTPLLVDAEKERDKVNNLLNDGLKVAVKDGGQLGYYLMLEEDAAYLKKIWGI